GGPLDDDVPRAGREVDCTPGLVLHADGDGVGRRDERIDDHVRHIDARADLHDVAELGARDSHFGRSPRAVGQRRRIDGGCDTRHYVVQRLVLMTVEVTHLDFLFSVTKPRYLSLSTGESHQVGLGRDDYGIAPV